MNKHYDKPTLDIEAFEVEDAVTLSVVTKAIEKDVFVLDSSGMEFNIGKDSN